MRNPLTGKNPPIPYFGIVSTFMIKILDKFTSIFSQTSENRPPFFKRVWRVLINSIRGFIEDDCYAKASALTFYSLLSVVPVLAVLFGVAKGFGFENALRIQISERFVEQPELTEKLIQFAYSWLKSVQGGLIAGVGAILLLWSVLGLLNNIEAALNAIWKIKASRSYSRKISNYLATIVIIPIFLVATGSINLFLTTHLEETAHSNVLVGAVSPFLLFILKLFPYFLSWVLFTLVYLFMPNTKVYLISAIIAGVLGGTAFQIWQWIYIKFQVGASSYGAIYGSFAALPLFLIWLQVSWLIFLAGAELAVELENDIFIPNRTLIPLSGKAAALLITYQCIEAFDKGEGALTDRALSQELGMSLNHIHTLIEALYSAKILSTVSFADKTNGYQPARAINKITMKNVCDAIDKSNEIPSSVRNSETMAKIQDYLTEADQALTKLANKPLYP